MSLRKMVNKSGDKFSPCLTPVSHKKGSDASQFNSIMDLIPPYTSVMICKHFPLTP